MSLHFSEKVFSEIAENAESEERKNTIKGMQIIGRGTNE